jgi:hypothetical protein
VELDAFEGTMFNECKSLGGKVFSAFLSGLQALERIFLRQNIHQTSATCRRHSKLFQTSPVNVKQKKS